MSGWNRFVRGMGKTKIKSETSEDPPAKRSHWSQGLLISMEDPEQKVKEDDKIVIIKDKYPKAKFHYLILPKEDISSIFQVKKGHENLLEHMEKVGQELIRDHNDDEFIMGYHATPSMHRLHMHVISRDFISPCLKTKQHWNSFTTPYFLKSQDVRKKLQELGKIERISHKEAEDYLKSNLKCHKCSVTPKNMPELKKHLLTHIGT